MTMPSPSHSPPAFLTSSPLPSLYRQPFPFASRPTFVHSHPQIPHTPSIPTTPTLNIHSLQQSTNHHTMPSDSHTPLTTPVPEYPRILVVSRRSIRKDKYIDFVGEYHLDLLTHFNALPIIVPRVRDVLPLLSSLHPIHGLLLTEGEDVGPDHLPPTQPLPTPSLLSQHPSDATPDPHKDSIEFTLVKHCLSHNIPILAICRGAQVVNLAAGGTLHHDLSSTIGDKVQHIAYDNYDAHRHPLHLLPKTPIADWFDQRRKIQVNSYHHQGIDGLASCFAPMAYAPDGLVEAYYAPQSHDVSKGQFVVGLQFHPERMQSETAALAAGNNETANQDSSVTTTSAHITGGENNTSMATFEYEGCTRPYRDFVAAAAATMTRGRKGSVKEGVTHGRVSLTQDEVNRLLRSGATVHGATLMRRLLDVTPSTDVMSSLRNGPNSLLPELPPRHVATVNPSLDGPHTKGLISLQRQRGRRAVGEGGKGDGGGDDGGDVVHMAELQPSSQDFAQKVRNRLREAERVLRTLRGDRELAVAERLLERLSLLASGSA